MYVKAFQRSCSTSCEPEQRSYLGQVSALPYTYSRRPTSGAVKESSPDWYVCMHVHMVHVCKMYVCVLGNLYQIVCMCVLVDDYS